eukprot:865780-Lingulodinium_polyedra.AAC.1
MASWPLSGTRSRWRSGRGPAAMKEVEAWRRASPPLLLPRGQPGPSPGRAGLPVQRLCMQWSLAHPLACGESQRLAVGVGRCRTPPCTGSTCAQTTSGWRRSMRSSSRA